VNIRNCIRGTAKCRPKIFENFWWNWLLCSY